MSSREDDCNKLAVGAGRLTSKAKFGVAEGWIDPSVGRFKTNKTWRCLDKNEPPLGIKTEDIVAKSIAPECNYGILHTVKVPTSLLQLLCSAFLMRCCSLQMFVSQFCSNALTSVKLGRVMCELEMSNNLLACNSQGLERSLEESYSSKCQT